MEKILDNPVFHAMLSGDGNRCSGSMSVKYFDPEISPFVGLQAGIDKGFKELGTMLPSGRTILYANRELIKIPPGWELRHHIEGLQFVYSSSAKIASAEQELLPLEAKHVDEMIQLARLTKPGPFDKRTIEFGHYYGIFENGRLVAMTGQRLHPYNYTEISAVCTHPDFLGKGYARALFNYQAQLIRDQGQIPFLHVRADNSRAIELYERNGFVKNGPMQFYFMKKE